MNCARAGDWSRFFTQGGNLLRTPGRCFLESFPASEWMAAMCSHIPNRGEQMVRYYGYYSNVVRGKWKQKGTDDVVPGILQPVENYNTPQKLDRTIRCILL